MHVTGYPGTPCDTWFSYTLYGGKHLQCTQQDLYTMTLGRQAGSKRGGIGGMVEDVLEADLEDRG